MKKLIFGILILTIITAGCVDSQNMKNQTENKNDKLATNAEIIDMSCSELKNEIDKLDNNQGATFVGQSSFITARNTRAIYIVETMQLKDCNIGGKE